MRPGVLLAAAVGLAFAGAVAVAFTPGETDPWRRALTGVEAPDEGYWSAPLRRLARAGDQDDYDHDLALSMALPQNALGALAHALGAPYERARFVGPLLSAALLAAAALAWLARRTLPERIVGVALLVALLSPPVLGHLRSDLGEATALGLAALWGLAVLRGRLGLAGVVAGLAITQKTLGASLGVGLLGAVVAAHAPRAAFARALLGGAVGLLVAAATAALVFGDAPLAFLARPFVATDDTGAGARGLGLLVQAGFVGHHGVGVALLPFYGAATLLLALVGSRRVAVGPTLAAAAGLAFSGAFPDPWRVVPTLPLLALALAPPPREDRRTLPAWTLLLLLLPQAVGAALSAFGRFGALALGLFTLAAAIPLRWMGQGTWMGRRGAAPPDGRPGAGRVEWRPAAAAVLALVGAAGSVAGSMAAATGSRDRLDAAAQVASLLPPGAHLVGYSLLSTRFAGTLWYPPFAPLWADELARKAPDPLYRLRVPAADEAGPPPAPTGYAVVDAVLLGLHPYNREEHARPLLLETLRRAP